MNLLQTEVTCGKYVKAETGTLRLSEGRVRFDTAEGCVFDTPVAAIEKIVWHWYSFSGALEAFIGGKSYFLSFVPRNAQLGSWSAGLATGRQWRAALEGRTLPVGKPLFLRAFLGMLWIFRLLCLLYALVYTLSVATDTARDTFDRIVWGGILSALLSVYIILMIVMAVRSPKTA